MDSEYNDLIRQLQKGSAEAYKELFDKFFMKSYYIAYSYMLDDAVAQDIVQEVFISIYDHSDRLKDIKNLHSYIITSVRNRCLNHLRDLELEDRNKRLYYESLIFSSNNEDDEETKNLIALFEKEIPKLPENCRIICKMRFSKGMKIKDIAQELDLAEGTVKVQIHRAIAKIKSKLDKK